MSKLCLKRVKFHILFTKEITKILLYFYKLVIYRYNY